MRTVVTLISVAFLAACGGPGSRLAPPSSGIETGAAVGEHGRYAGTVFVSDLDNDAVWVCPANDDDIRRGYLPPTGQLQGVSEPMQVAVDAQGTIYVANAQTDATGAGAVTEYPRGATSAARTLTAGLNTSTGVAVDSAGTVYVSNKYLGSIVIFPKGTDTPKATITANLTGPDGLAVDKSDDLFIADGSANDVLELVHGSKAPRSLHLEDLSRPVGVAIDSHGDLFVSNLLGASSTVGMYLPGSTKPKLTIVVPGPPDGSQSTIGEPAMLSVTKPGDILIASAPISLTLIGGKEWFGYAPAVDGFASGQKQPLWIQYENTGYDAVFQPAK
jgi:DNA-binding beta-propeller fold protein YncE